ncbi:hypothetical protein SAMN05443665_107115 [Actinomadura meyerae]|uniref:Secreted protein n=1 Tax=Actinomadura meyerae TaxID=240840 RepID=A0A239P5T3_9ACTN|nr:hypothetical protein [Actinomadura meyerae]SNT62370.1 hypothetical protein SAMN05443665_107115 [Actinomadura meyerae]
MQKMSVRRGNASAARIRHRLLAGTVAVVAMAAGMAAVESPAGAAPYGPYTCKTGFVWREAVPNDQVCVTPQVRDQAATENALAASRRQPGGGAYGPDTCKTGFVWRLARPRDLVCVPPSSRTQAYNDNFYAAYRLLEPASVPQGTLRVTDVIYPYNGGVDIWVWGNNLIPNNVIRFYAIQPTRPTTLIPLGGPVPVNAWGAISNADPKGVFLEGRACLGDKAPATVIGVEQATGAVVKAGTTEAFMCHITKP